MPKHAPQKYSLLLVDDDPFILAGIGEDLESRGYQVTRANSGEKAVNLLEHQRFDLVITDLIMERTDGIQVLKKSKEIDATAMVIILTGFGDMLSAIDALRNRADDYMVKPCDSSEMFFRVERCLEKRELARRINLAQRVCAVCVACRKILDDTGTPPGPGQWVTMEQFIQEHSRTDANRIYCPECARNALYDSIKK
jgi:DNA-binding NtrC family response regulator